jgi:hypothetical protein
MNPPASVSGIVLTSEMHGDTAEETALLRSDLEAAKRFLLHRRWCFGIGDVYFGAGLGGVVSVFLVEIAPKPSHIDPWLWVIVGDIPPAYLVLDRSPNPIAALENYLDLMEEWVELARLGETSDQVIPVNAASTPENADELQKRLTALREHIIPWLKENQPNS